MEKENNADGVQGSENYFFGNGVGYTNLLSHEKKPTIPDAIELE